MGNLLKDVPRELAEEMVDVLVEKKGVRIERIISTGQSTPDDEWMDQDRNEWVLVVSGAARLSFKDPQEVVEMSKGDWANIEAGRKHRVDWTTENQPTIWVTVFYDK